ARIAQSLAEEGPRFPLARGMLGRLQAHDLAAHERPVGPVEVEQGNRRPVAALLEVRVEEGQGEVRPAEALEVDGQEGDLARGVAVAKAMVELDAVEDLDRVGAADVL